MTEQSKPALRATAIAARDALSPEFRMHASHAIAERGLPVPVSAGATVSGFMPIGSEIDPLPLMKKLEHDLGAKLALPVVVGRGKPLLMRKWSWDAPLIEAVWKIKVPRPEAGSTDPDILVVPLAVFDRRGHRIGYGAGYYDRTIAGLKAKKRITTVGIAFSVQEIPLVPNSGHDQQLDFIMTEKETIASAKDAAGG